MTEVAWATWVANQPVLVAALLFAIAALARVVVVLDRRNDMRTDQLVELVKDGLKVAAANTAATEAHTKAVDRVSDALRGKR